MMVWSKKKSGYVAGTKQVLIILISLGIIGLSVNGLAYGGDSTRREPPPHPKPKSIKEIWKKINPFKKKDKNSGDDKSKTDDRKDVKPPDPAPPPPSPKPTVKHTPAKKKAKAKPSTQPKKTDKPTQPLI
jgi:type IV secretory pathway VirB10-like protein